MSKSNLRSATRDALAVLVVAGLLSMGSLASDKKASAPAPARSAPASRPAAPVSRPSTPVSRPQGNFGGGAVQRPNAGPSANRPIQSGPSANRPTVNGPSANRQLQGGPSANNPTANGPSNRQFQGGPSANRPSANGPSVNRPSTTGGSGFNGGNRPSQVQPGQRFNGGTPGQRGGANQAFQGRTPKGNSIREMPGGSAVRIGPNGQVREVHDANRGMDIHRGLNGNRRISMERPDHSRFVSERGRPGFAERPYAFHGHDFERRAYFYHGREYDRFYRGYGFHGVFLNVYAPGLYYGPGFYGWAYNPWATPIAFGWGWGGSSWYGYYGGYFQPYAVYPSASYWLTDYIISRDLQAAYAAHQEAGEVDGTPAAVGASPELTPEVKQQIADEIRNQLALENMEAAQTAQHQDVDPASSGIARLLADGKSHVFVAGGALDLVDANGLECGISDGDVLALQTPPPTDAIAADLVVVASKGGQECQKLSTVTVQLIDLQEMQNQMRATIDQGLQELQAKQGKNGLPVAPPSAQAKPTQTEYASIVPPPDPKDATELQQQAQQADQAEKEVTGQAQPTSGASFSAPSAAPASIELGQTPGQVEAAMGAPARVADLGSKVIYYYNGMKVVFKDGKVTDVQ